MFHRSDLIDNQRGYTLIEVVVALGLLAFGLTLLLGSLSNGIKQVRRANDAGRAALHAQSVLAQVGVGESLVPGQRSGELDEGRYRWQLDVAPFVDATAASRDPRQTVGAPQLLQLHLVVSWGDDGPRQRLDIRTLRLVTSSVTDPFSVVP